MQKRIQATKNTKLGFWEDKLLCCGPGLGSRVALSEGFKAWDKAAQNTPLEMMMDLFTCLVPCCVIQHGFGGLGLLQLKRLGLGALDVLVLYQCAAGSTKDIFLIYP